jgi:hypothetical protein
MIEITPTKPTQPATFWRTFVESLLIFALFALQGAWPVPEVNEQYYLGKSIHYWNPYWASGDIFLQSPDTHKVFYFTVGWLSLWLSPDGFAWTVRAIIWAVQALAWHRLAAAVCGRPGFALLSAALFLFLWQHFNMAGEWVVGAAEAKGFAFALVFFGMAEVLAGRWTRVWPLLGGAAAFHVLVGGWAILAAGGVWLWGFMATLDPNDPLRASWKAMAISIAVGAGLFSLGAVPSLALERGVDAETIRKAHLIYVFERLGHHLNPARFFTDGTFWPMLLIVVMWAALGPTASRSAPLRRLRIFTLVTLGFIVTGLLIGLLVRYNKKDLAASLLRFYWFRLADVVIPLSLSLTFLSWIYACRFRVAWTIIVFVSLFHIADCTVLRLFADPPVLEQQIDGPAWRSAWLYCTGRPLRPLFPRQPRADRMPTYASWRDACDWIATSGQIPSDARFFVPRGAQSFKWYSGRGEVFDWKEIPQDAAGLVEWWSKHKTIYVLPHPPPLGRFCDGLDAAAAENLKQLAVHYQAGYAIVPRETSHGTLPLEVLYENPGYIVYKVR